MRLDEYRFRKKTTYKAIADRVGCSKVYLNQIATGTLKASLKLARLIEFTTGGEVTVADLDAAHADYLAEKAKKKESEEKIA